MRPARPCGPALQTLRSVTPRTPDAEAPRLRTAPPSAGENEETQ
ncbi:hypothetical protein BJ976_000721 [Micrococcus flavus]|uniref:Uncharacterized protein n=1 Tax=Micrococcus flavus TaxID=384602 RepID=A0A7W7L2B9_9MICC|nr:hypothetical protein [Micrococcus flavus]